MRRLAALVLGGAALLPSGPARADEPDPEKVARIIEQIRAYRAEKERAAGRLAPAPGAVRRSDVFPRDVQRRPPIRQARGTRPEPVEGQAPREAPSPAPTGGEGR